MIKLAVGDMRVIFTVPLIVFTGALFAAIFSLTAAAKEPLASELDQCAKEAVAQCDEAHSQAVRQCDRYFLKRTEANPLCHESANKRQEICKQRAKSTCAETPAKAES